MSTVERKTGRRSLETKGFVNFPLHLKSTQEGGMFVKMWVMEKEDAPFHGVCSGTTLYEVIQESLRGSDKYKAPDLDEFMKKDNNLDVDAYDKAWSDFIYKFKTEITDGVEVSAPLLASVLMGSTGWSGDFLCTYEDLSPEGKELYDHFKKMYPQAEIHLVTFIDT